MCAALKDDEIEQSPDVGLVFIDHADHAYLSITARAEVLDDHVKAREIWKKTDDMWWQGPDDPNVRVLRVEPSRGGTVGWPGQQAGRGVSSSPRRALTGEKPNLGENRKVTVDLR